MKRDEIIFEISTDKVDTEVPSPVDGTLKFYSEKMLLLLLESQSQKYPQAAEL